MMLVYCRKLPKFICGFAITVLSTKALYHLGTKKWFVQLTFLCALLRMWASLLSSTKLLVIREIERLAH